MRYVFEIEGFEARAKFMRNVAGKIAVGEWSKADCLEVIGSWEGKMNPAFDVSQPVYEWAQMHGYLDEQDAVFAHEFDVEGDEANRAFAYLLWNTDGQEGKRLWSLDVDRMQMGVARLTFCRPIYAPGWTYYPNRDAYIYAEFPVNTGAPAVADPAY